MDLEQRRLNQRQPKRRAG